MTGKSTGTNIDDAMITATVKKKLVVRKISTLTKIDVDTKRATVYLTGNVASDDLKVKATQIAPQVAGGTEVVNDLKMQSLPGGLRDRPGHRNRGDRLVANLTRLEGQVVMSIITPVL